DRGAEFETATGQVIQQAHFLDDAGRVVVGQHHTHDPEPELARARGNRGDQQVWGRGKRSAEMVLAEKYSLEAERLVLHPEIEITREISRDRIRLGVVVFAAQLRKKLEDPWIDHSSPVLFFCGEARGSLCGIVLR